MFVFLFWVYVPMRVFVGCPQGLLFWFVPRLVFILRCKTTISVFVCLLRIIAAPVYVLVYPVDVSFWLDVLYLIQIA